jgi:hypothetical protein
MASFFEKLGETINKASENFAKGPGGSALQIGRLNSRIIADKTMISNYEKEIGKYYYNKFRSGGEVDDGVLDLCRKIEEKERGITEMKEVIQKAKDDISAAAGAAHAHSADGAKTDAAHEVDYSKFGDIPDYTDESGNK